MRQEVAKKQLPESYFDGKDGTGYRFTILKDVAEAGGVSPIPYDDSHQDSIIQLYSKYKDFTLYVHFPWCIEHCSYCYYYQSPVMKRDQTNRMLEAEKKHAAMFDEWIDLPNRNIRSIYFGGGTPTVVPTGTLDDTLGYYVDRYGKNDECEVCLECSIITLKPRRVEILERYINRLSIGVQSFDDRMLKVVERMHSASQAIEVLQEVIPRFPSVNVDLIYGLYDQDLDIWLKSVEQAIRLGTPSLTIYRLDIREVPSIIKQFRTEPHKFPDEKMCRRMYGEAKQMLLQAGYRENLIGWFLLPQIKDTTVYRERWEKQSPCIALGPRLHNYGADHFYESLDDHDSYIAAVESGKLPVSHIHDMTPKKQLVWYVLAQLKSNSPVYKSVMRERFGNELPQWFMTRIGHYLQWGVLDDYGDAIEINETYYYILEWVLLDLIDAI